MDNIQSADTVAHSDIPLSGTQIVPLRCGQTQAPETRACEPCKADRTFRTALFYCPNCTEYYCPDCGQRHALFKLTSGHALIPLADADGEHIYEEIPDATFDVDLVETTASARCCLTGRFKLLLKPTEICLLDSRTWGLLYVWPLTAIRGFGVTPNKSEFLFEAGRRCETGEGFFRFQTSKWKTVYETVQSRVKKKQ